MFVSGHRSVEFWLFSPGQQGSLSHFLMKLHMQEKKKKKKKKAHTLICIHKDARLTFFFFGASLFHHRVCRHPMAYSQEI